MKLRQNKIDYIVFHDPVNASALLESFDYMPPANPFHLSAAIKELVKNEGRPAVEALVKIHPDRKAILKVENQSKNQVCINCKTPIGSTDQYCSDCSESSYIEEDKSIKLHQLTNYKSAELEAALDQLMSQYKNSPTDLVIGERIQLIWNELRKRVPADENKSGSQLQKLIENSFLINWRDAVIFLGLALTLGFILASNRVKNQ